MAVTGASLNPIYQRLNGADEYHPLDAETFNDWSMEAGDIVTVSRGSDSYQSPIHNMKVVWKGAPQTTISSTGKKERDTVTKQAKRKYGRGGSGLRSAEGLGHRIEETDEHWQSMYWDGYNGLSSRIEQTATYWQAEFNNMYDGLRGFVEITAEHWEAEFQNTYAGLVGYVEVTAEHWKTAFENAYAGLVGYVEVTAEGWHSEFQNAYTGMIGYVDATADHWESVINSTASSIRASLKVTADTVAAVVQGTGDNAYIKPAVIKASIDADTGSLIVLSADRVKLDANTTISGVLGVENGGLKVKGSAVIDGTLTMTSGNNIVAGTIRATSIDFPGENPGSYISLTASEADSMIVKANLDTSTNTLQLWKRGDPAQSPSITFRKAASTKVSGSWSGGIITVSADENGDDSYVRSFGRGTVSWQGDKKAANVYVNVIRTSGGSEYVDVADAFSIYVPTTDSYNAGWDYGLTQRVRTAAEATSQELTIKTLSYGQRWTIKDTYTASNGTTSEVKYTVAAPDEPTITGVWDYSGTPSSSNPKNKYVVKKDGTEISGLAITVTADATITYDSSTHTYTATSQASAGGSVRGTDTATGGTEAYNAGWDYGLTQKVRTAADATQQELTTKSLDFGQRWTIKDTYTASNGTTSEVKYTVSAPARPADPTITAVWEQSNPSSSANPYNKYVVKKDGTEISGLAITVTADATISYDSTSHTYTATAQASAGGSVRGTDTAPSGTEAYKDGWDYGLTQRVRTAADATQQELTIKTLSYGQRWTIKDTYTASNGTTSDVKYTVAAPTDSNLIDSNIKSGVTIFGVTGSYSASSTVTAEWQQSNPSSSANPYNKYVVKKDGTTLDDLTITVTPSVSISYNSSTHNYTATGSAVAGGALRGTTTVTGGTEAYNAGWDYGQTQRVRSTATATSQETTIKSLDFGERWTITDTYTASNGTTSTVKYTVAAPSRPADPTITAAWEQTNPSSSANPYNKYVVKKDGTTISGLTITVTAGASISYNSSTHKYTATGTASAGGSQRGSATSTSGTEAYDAGSTAGYNSAHLTSSWNSAGTRLTVTKTTSGSYNSLSFDVSADVAISYNSTFHTYYATGYALVDSITRASSGNTSGTEAYDAGYNTGYDAGYAAGSGGGITWAGMEIDGSTATSRTITSATDVDLIVRQNGSYITLQSITLTPSGGTTYSHSASIKCTNHSQETHGTVTVHTYTYTQSINSANPIVGVGSSRTVYWP